PRFALICRARVIAEGRFHGVGSRVGDVVALVEDVDLPAGVDHHRRAVAPAGGETRADVSHLAPCFALVGRLLHDDVEVAGGEPATAACGAEERDRSTLRSVVPRHVNGAVRPDGDEVAVAPVLGVRRYQVADLGKGRAVVERGGDTRIPLRAVV